MGGANFMVKPQHMYKAASELNKAMGFSRADTFFSDPGTMDWPEPAPDTKVLENKRRVEDDRAKNQIAMLEAQSAMSDKQSLAEYRQRELDLKKELAVMEMEVRKEIAEMQSKAKGESRGDSEESE